MQTAGIPDNKMEQDTKPQLLSDFKTGRITSILKKQRQIHGKACQYVLYQQRIA